MILGIDGRFANMARRAGVGAFSHALLAALPSAAGDWRLRVYLDATPRDDFPLSSDQAQIRVLPAVRWWTQRALARELAAHPPDVYFSPLLQLPWRCGSPAVPVAHDLAFLRFPEEFTWQRRIQAQLQARHAARNAAHIVAVSEATANDVRTLLGVPASRISVALEAAAPQFQPQPPARIAEVRARHALPEHYVLYLGRLQPRKNIARLVAAFEQVLARRPDLPHHLLIGGGKGWLFDQIFASVAHSPARDRIRFLDFVPEEDLPAFYTAADAVALVSRWEGFGLPVLEAMACGAPVLTSDVSSLPEIAGHAALLVNPDDTTAIAAHLERLMEDPGLRDALRQRGHVRAAQFAWEKTAAAVMQAVEHAARR
jgi:glycosyltransferase involved in cell wall biosynthesis